MKVANSIYTEKKLMRKGIKTESDKASEYVSKMKEFAISVTDPWVSKEDDWWLLLVLFWLHEFWGSNFLFYRLELRTSIVSCCEL